MTGPGFKSWLEKSGTPLSESQEGLSVEIWKSISDDPKYFTKWWSASHASEIKNNMAASWDACPTPLATELSVSHLQASYLVWSLYKEEHTYICMVVYCSADSDTTGILLCSAWQSTWRTGMWPFNNVRHQYASAQLTPPQAMEVIFAEQLTTQRRLAVGITLSTWLFLTEEMGQASNTSWSCCSLAPRHFPLLFLLLFLFCFVMREPEKNGYTSCRPPSPNVPSTKSRAQPAHIT